VQHLSSYPTCPSIMDSNKFLSLLGAIFGLLGSVSVTYSIIAVSPEEMFLRARFFFDYSPHLVASLAEEKATQVVGFHFVAISFLYSVLVIFHPKNVRPGRLWLMAMLVLSGAAIIVVLMMGIGIYQHDKLEMERLAKEFIEKAESKRP
jgi:hypothetical protein